jgi:hypothetical protein
VVQDGKHTSVLVIVSGSSSSSGSSGLSGSGRLPADAGSVTGAPRVTLAIVEVYDGFVEHWSVIHGESEAVNQYSETAS